MQHQYVNGYNGIYIKQSLQSTCTTRLMEICHILIVLFRISPFYRKKKLLASYVVFDIAPIFTHHCLPYTVYSKLLNGDNEKFRQWHALHYRLIFSINGHLQRFWSLPLLSFPFHNMGCASVETICWRWIDGWMDRWMRVFTFTFTQASI